MRNILRSYWGARAKLKLRFKFIAYFLLVCAFYSPISFSSSHNYFTYVGGDANESSFSSVLDSQGNIYVTGQTHSGDFIGLETNFTSPTVDQNCFISKININTPEDNKTIIFGGSTNEVCREIIIDQQSIYVIGETQSSDFPVTDTSQLQGNWDGFLVKLDETLNIEMATFIGGDDTDFAHGIDFFSDDKLVIVGETWSANFPTTPDSYIEDCTSLEICDGIHANGFIYIVNKNSMQLVYSSYLGGSHNDKAHTVTVSNNSVIVVGETQSQDFPLIHQISNSLKGNLDAFVAELQFQNDSEAELVFSTYLGGNGGDSAMLATVDAQRNIIVAGETSSDDFPTTENAFSRRCANSEGYCISNNKTTSDVFLAQFSPTDHELKYSSFFGGSENDVPASLYLDVDNRLWITGKTHSTNLPLSDNAQQSKCSVENDCKKNSDGFMVAFNLSQTKNESVNYASFFGGQANDQLSFLSIKNGKLILAGDSFSTQMASSDALNPTNQNGDSFIHIQAIPEKGTVFRKTITSHSAPSSGALNPTILLCFLTLLLISKTRCRNK